VISSSDGESEEKRPIYRQFWEFSAMVDSGWN